MAAAKPEYGIVLAAIVVLVAVGVPSIGRGDRLVGWLCLALAAGVLATVVITVVRSRR